MVYKLDKKDVKILFYLFEDGRISLSQLAKKVELSKNAVKHRVERLEKRRIIEGFTTIIDHEALGLTSFTLLIEFNDDIYENGEIKDYFIKHDFTNWVAVLSGKWDLLVEYIVKDFNHKTEILEDLLENLGPLINNYKFYLSDKRLRIEHLVEDIYKDVNLKKKLTNPIKKDLIKLDEIDKQLLAYLSKNSLENYVIIANALNLTVDIVTYRIKKLTKLGVIEKFIPLIETSHLGYTEYLYVFNLRNSSREKLDKFKSLIENHVNILYAFFDIATFSLILSPTFKEPFEMDEFSRKIKKEFGEIIDSQDYFMIREHLYFNLFPDGLLK